VGSAFSYENIENETTDGMTSWQVGGETNDPFLRTRASQSHKKKSVLLLLLFFLCVPHSTTTTTTTTTPFQPHSIPSSFCHCTTEIVVHFSDVCLQLDKRRSDRNPIGKRERERENEEMMTITIEAKGCVHQRRCPLPSPSPLPLSW
jgi:hypothetical protein